MQHHRRWSFWTLALGLCLSLGAAPNAAPVPTSEIPPEPTPPWVVGERITYSIGWGVFNVGSAVLEVTGKEVINGLEAWRIDFRVRTNSFADRIYKVREHSTTWICTDLQRTLRYRKDAQEGDDLRRYTIDFDWEAMTATRYTDDETLEPVELVEPVFDALSVVFAARLRDHVVDERFVIPLSDGRKLRESDILVAEQENIKTGLGRVDAFRLEPNLRDIGGVFKRSDGASLRMWFSDDEARVPVRMESSVVVGSFHAYVVAIENSPAVDSFVPIERPKPRGGRRGR